GPVCKLKVPPRSLKVIIDCAAMLIFVLELTAARAPVETVPGEKGPSKARMVPSVGLRKESRLPEPAAPGRMVMIVAGSTRDSRMSNPKIVRWTGGTGFGAVRELLFSHFSRFVNMSSLQNRSYSMRAPGRDIKSRAADQEIIEAGARSLGEDADAAGRGDY